MQLTHSFKNPVIYCVAALWMAFAMPVLAAESLMNTDVEVDVTGSDAADARELALAKGQADALADLLSRFTTGEQAQQIVGDLEPKKIASMARGTEVLSEKISSNRYRASLRISFDATEVSTLLGKPGGDANAELAPTATGSFLIIPSYEEDGTVLLWDDANPWRNAWKTAGIEARSGDIVVPFGDAADAASIDVKTLPSANYASLLPLTVRYGVTDIVLVQAKLSHDGGMTLEVVKRRLNRTQNEVNLLTYRADPQETRDTLMARATHDVIDTLEHKKTEETEAVKTIRGGNHGTVMVLASISTLSSWTQLRTKLSTLPMIDKIEPLAISPQQVDLVIHYRGSADSLATAITARNIRLVQNSNYWVISRE